MRMESLNEPNLLGIESVDTPGWDGIAVEDISSPSATPVMVNPTGKCGGCACGCFVVNCMGLSAC
ncbi:MAG: hypothetical protein HXS52_02275 [Theionarchaea archaeon]|nr:hypothetical protein [Theionarchaea archaeon]MBU7036731.1 hypothetical protein [Theionarchaea archaeon]